MNCNTPLGGRTVDAIKNPFGEGWLAVVAQERCGEGWQRSGFVGRYVDFQVEFKSEWDARNPGNDWFRNHCPDVSVINGKFVPNLRREKHHGNDKM